MTTDLSHIPVLVPEDVEDAGDLPMGVLDSASNHLKCDLIDAVKGEVPGKKYAAWAELCYAWAKYTGVPKASRETYREYRVEEISHALGWDREAAKLAEEEPDPTQPASSTTDASEPDSSESP